MKPKLSIILPSIHPEKWINIYNQIKKSMGEFRFEMIVCGPFLPTKDMENISNFKFIRDLGCVSRCFQIASTIAEGDYLCWCSDDYVIEENAMSLTFQYIDNLNIKDDGINLLFSEGPNFTGNQHLDLNYWNAHTHDDLRKAGVKIEWKTLGAFMYKTETWYKFGGLDCFFEHVNMNTHDLGFAIQAKGGRMINSPVRVFKADWKPWAGNAKHPIQLAWEENDKPRFEKLYSDPNYAYNRNIKIDNWKNCPSVWERRFKII